MLSCFGESKRSKPAGTPWAWAGATGAAEETARRAAEAKRTLRRLSFNMVVSPSKLTRRSGLDGRKYDNTASPGFKVTSQLRITARYFRISLATQCTQYDRSA